MRKILGSALAACCLAVFTLGAQPAFANDDDVIVEKDCSGPSDLKLKLSPEHGRIEVEFEVDQNVVGDSWRVVLRHDGERFFRGVLVTQEPSGSFEVRRVVDNEQGDDLIQAKARNLATDELCRGAAVATFGTS
ncbi:MAG: hypothetical protein WD739_01455 [Actinomycetota bacterium]